MSPQTPRQGLSRRSMLKLMGGITAGVLAARAAPFNIVRGQTELRYWTWMGSDADNPRANAQKQILALFQERNPNIKIVEEVIPWQNIHQQLLQAAAANRAPDVSRQLDRYILTLAEARALTPLDEFIAGWSEERKNDYVYDWDDTTVNGVKYAFRQAVRPLNVLYYRTDLFQAAGFETAPRTLDAFTEAVKATTRDNIIGFMMPFSKTDGMSKFIQQCPPMYWVLGSDLVDLSTGKATFHLEAGQQIFQWMQDMVYVHKVMPAGAASTDSETVNSMFIGGTLATNFDHSSKWAQWSLAEAVKGNIDTFWTPNFANKDEPVPVSTAGAWTLVVPRGAKREEAWKLMEFMQSNEAELIDAQVGGELPTRKSTLEAPFFATPEAERMNNWLKYMAENRHPATSLKIKKIEVLADALADAAQEIIANQADVKTALAAAAAKYDAAVG